MDKLLEALIEEKTKLEATINKLKNSISKAPDGTVRVAKQRNSFQFYFNEDIKVNKNGKYMPKSEEQKALKILEKEYNIRYLQACEARLSGVNRLISNAKRNNLETVQLKMGKIKSELIEPYAVDDITYRKMWEDVQFTGKGFMENMPEIYTEKGERVRSKSEKIIADRLYKERIPYRYEYPIKLNEYGKVYPDFTILDMKNRKEVILEHLGMMDREEYVSKALRKIASYERSGLIIGVDLIFTYETSYEPFDGRALDRALKNYDLI